MHKMKLFIIALAAVAIGAVSATSAQASRGIRVSPTTITANGNLTLNGGATVCRVSLTLNVPSGVILKNTTLNQGTVSAGSITGCSGLASSGAVLVPITVRYRSFSGTLPNITAINILAPNAGFSLNTIAGTCLYGGALDGVSFPVTGGQVRTVNFTGSSTLPRVSGSAFCPATGSITGSLTVLAPIPTVTLIN